MVDESLGLNTSSGRLDQKKEGKYFMNKWMDKDPRDPLKMCQFVHFQKLCMYRSKINHELVQSLETPLFYVLSYRRKLKFPILFCDTKLHMHTKIYLHLNCSTSASNLTCCIYALLFPMFSTSDIIHYIYRFSICLQIDRYTNPHLSLCIIGMIYIAPHILIRGIYMMCDCSFLFHSKGWVVVEK